MAALLEFWHINILTFYRYETGIPILIVTAPIFPVFNENFIQAAVR